MSEKPQKFPSEAHAEADLLLAVIAKHRAILQNTQDRMEQELAQIRERWSWQILPLEAQISELAASLQDFEKGHHEDFFGPLESCRVDLPHGVLLYELTRPVKRVRTVTPELLEAEGFPEAVKIAKSVDWDLLATWPEARLVMIGTELRVKETFGYEIKETGHEDAPATA